MKTTRELFEEVINTKGIETTLGCAANTVYQLRRNFNNGKVSLDKMHEILEAAGYQVVQPTLWAKGKHAQEEFDQAQRDQSELDIKLG